MKIIDNQNIIFNIHLIATNVNVKKICAWLSGLENDSYRSSFADAISIITQIKDIYLRNSVLKVLFDESLNPWKYESTEEQAVLDRFLS